MKNSNKPKQEKTSQSSHNDVRGLGSALFAAFLLLSFEALFLGPLLCQLRLQITDFLSVSTHKYPTKQKRKF
jgi:hypothetical protein